MIFVRSKWSSISLVCFLLAVTAFPGCVSGAKSKSADAAKASQPAHPADPVIEEVTAKQLERILQEKDYVAVYWYARSCVTCDKVLAELEQIDDDTDSFGVDFVKINDKRLAKQYGIKNFPALTYFRDKHPIIFDGDIMDSEAVLDFLTSLEAMDLPDRIEEVNAKILEKIVEDTDYIAVLFYKTECRKCAKALQELENIDDEADQLGIGFVKIHDEDLADEYNLGALPKLVYYRHQIPIIYENELSREEDVLEWLIENKSTGDDEDIIEDVTAKTLNTLIGNVDNLVVLFYDHGEENSMTVLEELEKIDDDCDKHGIQFVKIDDKKAAKAFGLDEDDFEVPSIVYFEKQIPNIYDGDLEDENEILKWLLSRLEEDEIEDVTDEMLDSLIKEGKQLAVLFYDNNDRKSQKVLEELENIDDECDSMGILFVKIDNAEEAKEYGIEKVPKLLYFEKGIPTLYEGPLDDEDGLLKWLESQTSADEIEDITDEMLDLIIEKMDHVAVLFYDKDQKKSAQILEELENIDDDCDQNDIAFVKIDDDNEAREWGIDELPTMVLYEKGVPHVYEGDLQKADELLGWLIHQKRHSEIPEITDEMKDKLIETAAHLAVIFYDKDDKQDIRVLNELENIDDELEKEDIVIVRIDNAAEAKEYGLDHLPALVYFEEKIPSVYPGDLMNEDEVLEWLLLQKETASIEEVTDEILQELIDEHEYVVVYFTGPCDSGERCDNFLDDLENIDDELDEAGIIFVRTEDVSLAKKYNIRNLPQVVLFRNKEPLLYKGSEDEDEILTWLTDEDTLEIPGRIEEVNVKMLEKILGENDHIVVFFYEEGDKKSHKIINELENIDDECEEKDIDFVKTSDEGIQEEYDLPSLPALVFYRHKFRTIYTGNLMKEEEILEWVLDLHESPPDEIETVDRKTLQVLINEVEHLAVFFYDNKCTSCPSILEELETIDDDTDKHGIQFVKSSDAKLAHEIGIFSFPALVYYETGVPIMYDGNLKNENRVLQWLIDQKSDDDDDEDNDDDDEDNGDDEDDNDDDDDNGNDDENDDEDDDDEDNDDDEDDDEDEEDDEVNVDDDDEDNDDEDDDEDNNDEDDDEDNNDDDDDEDNNDDDDDDDDNNDDDDDDDENDGCFFVGLGHSGNAKKGSDYVPHEYRPFQCCPTKLERSTKVPKMTAAKIGHSQDKKNSGGSFKFGSAEPKVDTKKQVKSPTKPKTHTPPTPAKLQPVPTPSVTKKTAKKDTEDNRKVVRDTKSNTKQALATKGGKDKNMKGQKGLFGIGLNWW